MKKGDFISTKVAIASSDGKFVNQHFGRAQQFLIVEIKDDGSYEFIECRKNKPACHAEGHDASMEDTINLISDCEGVLVSQVGPGAADALISHRIQPVIIPMLIEDAIKHVICLMHQNP
ncbi:NifB/NifX family molybdenum-iron cluster-binding protein [Methanobacterium sp. ACI-7]|uniref:NifB/NifX family molybdenum-iron cluster-binding protein n=1 Tax=unclassified Methanobacterium TaxID=2627676 RepID=UPI0039C02E07